MNPYAPPATTTAPQPLSRNGKVIAGLCAVLLFTVPFLVGLASVEIERWQRVNRSLDAAELMLERVEANQ